MAARPKPAGKSRSRSRPKGAVRQSWADPQNRRERSHSEYFMVNFSLAETKKYLEKVDRPDVDAEGLNLALHRAILVMDQMRGELVMAERFSAKGIKNFQEDLSAIIKHAKKLCEILGVEESGMIKANYDGSKARYAHADTLNQKPNRADNLYWGLTLIALLNGKKIEAINQLQVPNAVESFGSPHFSDRIKDIGQDINLLRAIAENVRKLTTGGKAVFDSDYYSAGVSYGLTPDQWIIARMLPEIYEDFFGVPLHITRDRVDQLPYGRGLEFLIWCLTRIGITLSRETVCKYYYDYRIVSDA